MYPDELTLTNEEGAVSQRSAFDQADTAVGLSFDQIFERYQAMVYSLALRILGDREEALDVSQEVFLTIYRKLGAFRGESSLKTWIYCITANKASNRYRWWNRLRRRGTISLEEHLSSSSEHDRTYSLKSTIRSPEDALLIQEEQSEVEQMLLELPLQQRIAVVMRDIEGLSYEEIAETLKISIGTVKSRIARGRETLKQIYQLNALKPNARKG
jgi:RNA polymerase sigma-70 factor (ECF subfamily)